MSASCRTAITHVYYGRLFGLSFSPLFPSVFRARQAGPNTCFTFSWSARRTRVRARCVHRTNHLLKQEDGPRESDLEGGGGGSLVKERWETFPPKGTGALHLFLA